MRRTEGGAKIVGVFRVRNHDFTQKNHIFSNFRRGAHAGYPPPPPLDPPGLKLNYLSTLAIGNMWRFFGYLIKVHWFICFQRFSFIWGRDGMGWWGLPVAQSSIFSLIFRSLFAFGRLFPFFFWPLYCLIFSDLRLLITLF